jgi:subtilisin family serine protease
MAFTTSISQRAAAPGATNLVVAILAGATLSSAAFGDTEFDATLTPRQRFAGVFALAGDRDRIRYPALGGSELTVIAYAVGGSGARPRIELFQNGVALSPQISSLCKDGSEHRMIRVAVPADGDVVIELVSEGDALGQYRMKIRERLPAHHSWKGNVSAGGTKSIEFMARTGAKAKIEVTRFGESDQPVAAPTLIDPDGEELSLDGLVTAQESVLAVGPVYLTSDGTYRAEVVAGSDSSELLELRIDVVEEKGSAGIVVESAGEATAAGDVFLELGDWIGEDTAAGDFLADELVAVLRDPNRAPALAARFDLELVAVSPSGFARLRRAGNASPRVAATPAERAEVKQLCERIRREPEVEFAEPNHVRHELAIPNDPLFPQQWDYLRAGFASAADLVAGDAARTIAVLDTGIRFEHPDLAGRLIAGFDFVSDSWNGADGNGIDSDATDPLISQGTHGTHVAGTIVAARDNALGIAGAIGAGRVMPVRVLGVLGGTDFDIAQAILYAARLPNSSGQLPATRAEVINMSLGGPNPSALLDAAVSAAIEAGVVVVAAAGNANSKYPMYPAAIDGVIAVAATDAKDERAYYSSFGDHVVIAAPGGDPWVDADADGYFDGVLSCTVDPFAGATYTRKSGTSMAAPHVAAAAFLLRSVDPSLSPQEVAAYLCAGALDLGVAGKDKYFGYGRLDAGASVSHLMGVGPGTSALFAYPALAEFGVGVERIEVAVVPTGSGPVGSLTQVTCAAPWVSTDFTAGPLPMTLAIEVDRSGLLAGTWSATIEITTTTGALLMPVEVEVAPLDGPPAVSRVFVFAWDTVRHEVASIVEVEPGDAGEFGFDALPDGIAGEDHDFAGAAIHPTTGDLKFALAHGTSSPALTLILAVGGNVELPKNGSLPITIP